MTALADLRRLPDWPTRHCHAVAAVMSAPHEYGANDCALACAEAARAITGLDLGEDYRGRYSTYEGGMRLLAKKTGAASLQDWADGLWRRIGFAYARRGDWALVEIETEHGIGPVLMIIDGAFLVGPEQARLPLDSALACWAVGRDPGGVAL